MIDFARLRDAQTGLAAAITAFEDAAKTNDNLEEAIGNPHSKDKLRRRVGWFESKWDGNREDLTEKLTGIQERLTGIIDGWEKWEQDAAAALEEASDS